MSTEKNLHRPTGQRGPEPAVALPQVLREFCWVTVLVTGVSFLYCVLMRLVFHKHYPYDWPLFYPNERYSDFTIFIHKFEFFHQPAFFTTGFPINYPAPMLVFYEFFFKYCAPHPLRAFLLFMGLAFSVPTALFARALTRRGLSALSAIAMTGIALIFSWPALLLIDRANVEVLVFVVLATGTWAYSRGKDWTAAAMFGVAASLKLFPFVYFALFLTRRKLPRGLFGGLVFALLFLASLAIVGPTVAQANRGINFGLNSFRANYMARFLPDEGGLDHSPLAFIKAVLATVLRHHPDHASLLALKLYIPTMAIGGVLLYFLVIRRLPWMNQVLVLTIASIYFTPFSGDGTLIHLYSSFALCSFLAIDASKRQIRVSGLRGIFLCFALLFATESFFIVQGHRFEGQFKCIVIGALLVYALRYPLGPSPGSDAEYEIAYPHADLIEKAS